MKMGSRSSKTHKNYVFVHRKLANFRSLFTFFVDFPNEIPQEACV